MFIGARSCHVNGGVVSVRLGADQRIGGILREKYSTVCVIVQKEKKREGGRGWRKGKGEYLTDLVH